MKIRKWTIVGIIFTICLGILIHFTYNWSNKNIIIGIFSAVNESTWEHLKLLITPMLLFGAIEYFIYGKQFKNFIAVWFLSILIGMGTIIISFYTYVGIIGKNFLILDIATFILGVLAAYYFSYQALKLGLFSSNRKDKIGRIGIIVLVVCIILFTFIPPHIALFRDPVSKNYGI